jgi:predicted transposase YbfD/YdcC
MDGKATQCRCAPADSHCPSGGFLSFFQDIPDPRAVNAVHKLTDIMVLAFCAVLCGAQGWVDVEEFAQSKLAWFKTFLELPAGVPSHDTFGRVFAALCPEAFERCFTAWMASVTSLGGGKLLAIDGKSIRRSFEHGWDKSGMAHLVSAFVAANGLVFAQVAVKDKENEIVAIPKLLELLDLNGSVVSIDAIGCQRQIASRIVEGGGDYLLAVKENQPTLHKQVTKGMDELILESASAPQQAIDHSFIQTVDGDHGRIETRRVWVSDQVQWVKLEEPWPHLGSVIVVESMRQTDKDISTERRYFVTSLKGLTAQRAAQLVRGHWAVENNLHWQLDVSFDEDQRRIRKGHGAENFSRLCRIALNRLKSDKSKGSIRTKRLKAGWDQYYLFKLLTT